MAWPEITSGKKITGEQKNKQKLRISFVSTMTRINKQDFTKQKDVPEKIHVKK